MINVAIDGPGGAGKSTISRRLARELGYIYVDTGALYRAVGLYCVKNGVSLSDCAAVAAALGGIELSLGFVEGEQRVYLNGCDVSSEIRMPEVSMAASAVSAIPEVRAFLFSLQKDIARANDCIMDGRDIGTVVLPQAQIKIFLTASPEERARRRYDELTAKGVEADYNTVLDELIQRDMQDTTRAAAPLRPADDAQIVDTTGKDFEASVALLKSVILSKLQQGEQ